MRIPGQHLARRAWREWIRPFALLIVIVAPLKSAVVDWNWVPTGSMKPTILEGELVLINKLAYRLRVPFTTAHVSEWSPPERGDIAVFFSPTDGTRLVKRVIGLPGDTIEMRNEVLYINGQPQRYSAFDSAVVRRWIDEDPRPLLAVEHLDSSAHPILILPSRPALRTFGPLLVPAGHYFMLGDSRDNSNDSRFYGPVPEEQILGRAAAVMLSFDPSRYLLPRLSRFGIPFSDEP